MQAKLDLQIRQLHEAMGLARTADLSSVQPHAGVTGDAYYAIVDFSAGVSDAQLKNILTLCINNIACLKDHLKAWCKLHKKPFHGDTLIDTNRDVGIIHDLWNRDKHFDLKKSRTGLFPEIQNIHRPMQLTTQAQKGSWAVMTMNRAGQLGIHGDGRAELVVMGDVVDSTGARVGDVTEIAERAVIAWETTLAAAGVVIPPR